MKIYFIFSLSMLLSGLVYSGDYRHAFTLYENENWKGALEELTKLENNNKTELTADLSTAYFMLGKLHLPGDSLLFGNGIKADYEKAYSYFIKAGKGHAESLFSLYHMHSLERFNMIDNDLAVKFLQQAVALKDPKSIHEYGGVYYTGKLVQKDLNKAVKLFNESAELGFPDAYYTLAQLADKGIGQKIDQNAAITLYEKAASLGHIKSQSLLGYRFYTGDSAPLDQARAIKWLKQGWSNNDKRSGYYLADAYENGNGVGVSLVTARDLFQATYFKDSPSRHAMIDHKLECPKTATTTHIDTLLVCATRDDFSTLIKSKGAIATNEGDNPFFDSYETSALYPGSNRAHTYYTNKGHLAQIFYEFVNTSKRNTGLFNGLFSDITREYGHKVNKEGRVSHNNARYEWKFSDGARIVLKQQASGNVVLYFTSYDNLVLANIQREKHMKKLASE